MHTILGDTLRRWHHLVRGYEGCYNGSSESEFQALAHANASRQAWALCCG